MQLVLNFPSVIMLLASVESYHQQEIPIFVYLEFMSAILLAGFVSAYVIYRVAGKILPMGAPESANTLSLDDQKSLLQIGGFYFIVNARA
ncbi:MAG: hypothetical protein V7739_02220 [Motiliproteus sp.]